MGAGGAGGRGALDGGDFGNADANTVLGHGATGGSAGTSPASSDCAAPKPAEDVDGDGTTPSQGDCDECNRAFNPAAYDFPANGLDEDCGGTVDDAPSDCDVGLAIEATDPLDGAKAIGLCDAATDIKPGVISAAWTFADGTTSSRMFSNPRGNCVKEGNALHPMQHGALPSFGSVMPRMGGTMLALSSGVARAGSVPSPAGLGNSPAGAWMCTLSNTPEGFPKDSPACSVMTTNNHDALDPIALELVVRVPSNAIGFSFDFDFYTYEFPDFVCQQYNDFFVALLTSTDPATPADHNISFDSQGNPVSVNNGFVEVCAGPRNAGGKNFPCSLGTGELAGTGFEPAAATSWLRTEASVVPGETITLRFAIWDMGDEILDSTVLIDNFVWKQGEVPEHMPPPSKPPRTIRPD